MRICKKTKDMLVNRKGTKTGQAVTINFYHTHIYNIIMYQYICKSWAFFTSKTMRTLPIILNIVQPNKMLESNQRFHGPLQTRNVHKMDQSYYSRFDHITFQSIPYNFSIPYETLTSLELAEEARSSISCSDTSFLQAHSNEK